MLKRKIDKILEDWKGTPEHNPLIIKGCRQCGKTSSVLEFGKNNYESVIYLNFFENKIYNSIFADNLEIDNIIMLMSAILGTSAKFIPYKTLIIFDEIQECPEARTALKFFKLDGMYDVIGTEPSSIPVGYETIIDMYPMDFEEFLWANGIDEKVIIMLKRCLEDEKPVVEAIHKRMRQLMLQYVVVGGMPNIVNRFVSSKEMNVILKMQRDIIYSYEDDMVKYAEKKDKSLIKECFRSIPKQLAKENKKFQYSIVKKGASANKFKGSLQWIEDAGIISRCYNLNITELPLDGNAKEDVFKVYMNDTGLFVAMLEDGTQFDILQGNLLAYKGAIFENIVADFFTKMGRKLYYFHKDSGLEIDFIIRYKGQCTLVEVKATTGNVKSAKTILNHPEKYHVNSVIKLGDYNIGRADKILTLPLYLGFLLREN